MDQANWPEELLWLRSAVLRDTGDGHGEVVSMGFPKFFNAGERPGHTARMEAALRNGEPVRFTLKLDGSLAIRSVIDGEVVFRTRGSFDGGEHGQAIRAVAERRYPVLLDPEFEPDRSLLFEFVSPQYRIIIRYPEPDLVLLGAVCHRTLTLARMEELAQLAHANGLALVEQVELPRDPRRLLAAVRDWDGLEGVVVRCNADQTLVKVKSASYLARHRVRFSLTARVVRQLCEQHEVRSLDEFARVLADMGGDWEVAQDVQGLVDAYISGCRDAEAAFTKLQGRVEAAFAAIDAEDPRERRRRFAATFASKLDGPQRSAAFLLADGKLDQALRLLRDRILDERFAQAQAADDLLVADA